MKTKRSNFLLLILCFGFFSAISSYGQLSVDVGKDTTYCAEVGKMYLGDKLIIKNGVEPYSIKWECKVPKGLYSYFTASDLLSDTTVISPFFTYTPSNNQWIKFTIHITDGKNNYAEDSIRVRFSKFGYLTGYAGIEIKKGDSILFKYSSVGGGIEPLEYHWQPKTGLSNPDSLETWCKPNSTTLYDITVIDSCGCVSYPNAVYYVMVLPTGLNEINNDKDNFIAENKLWRIGAKIYSEPCCGHRNEAYRFQGDSIINDTIYSKLYMSTEEFPVIWQLYGLWRETKGEKIFKRDLNNHTESLMYDFSLVSGDTFKPSIFTLKVDSVLTINLGGKLRKHWYLNHVSGDKFYSTVWIEGIGETSSLKFGALSFLLCFSENGQLVYQNPEYNTCFYTSSINIQNPTKELKVYPNPVSGELFVQLTTNIDENYTLELYSVKGELVKKECLDAGSNLYRVDMSSLRNGIYILRMISDSGKYSEEVIIKE